MHLENVTILPLTPFHYPVAYFLQKLDRRLSLPGLIVGSMIPDLEIPIIMLLFERQGFNRLVLHSLLGSATVGTFLAILITRWIYPFLINILFRVDKEKVERKCKFSFPLAFSVFVGSISHVLLDVSNHPYNPIFWPFLAANSTASPLFFAFGETFGYWWTQVIMGVLLMLLIIMERKNFPEKLLME